MKLNYPLSVSSTVHYNAAFRDSAVAARSSLDSVAAQGGSVIVISTTQVASKTMRLITRLCAVCELLTRSRRAEATGAADRWAAVRRRAQPR